MPDNIRYIWSSYGDLVTLVVLCLCALYMSGDYIRIRRNRRANQSKPTAGLLNVNPTQIHH